MNAYNKHTPVLYLLTSLCLVFWDFIKKPNLYNTADIRTISPVLDMSANKQYNAKKKPLLKLHPTSYQIVN